MRILKFARIALIRARRYRFVIFFPIIAVFMILGNQSNSVMFSVAYCLFAGIILASIPFSTEKREEAGFLQMLPAKPGELILGIFTFGFFCILAGAVLGMISVLAAHLIRPSMDILRLMPSPASMAEVIGLALVFTGFQGAMLTLFRFDGGSMVQLLRLLPAFAFFFGMSYIGDTQNETIIGVVKVLAQISGWVYFLIGIAIYAVIAIVSSRLAERAN